MTEASIEILDQTGALHDLAPEWHALWSRHGRSAFQSPHWLLPWWTVFGTGAPRVAIARGAGALVGVHPAYVLDEPDGPKLLPIGAGTTDYLDMLGDHAAPLLHALLARAAADNVDRCDLIDTPPCSPLHGAAGPPGWVAAPRPGAACPVLRLGTSPAGIRRKLRMSRHRADRAGPWAVTEATPATIAEHRLALDTLHAARWQADGEPGVLASPAIRRFHDAALPGLLEAGLLRLCVLHADGPAAAALALLAPGRIEFYLSGYDPGRAFISPGTILLGAMLDQAEAEGRTEAHFLRGREAYKYAWGAEDRANADLAYRLA